MKAERDGLKLAIEALAKAGAKPSRALHQEQHGALAKEAREFERTQEEDAAAKKKAELFEGAATTCDDEGQQLSQKSKSPKQKAKKATSQMQEALSGIMKRGKKIEELGDKTDELEQNAAEYADLAGKLRAKMERKNKGLNFLNPFSK